MCVTSIHGWVKDCMDKPNRWVSITLLRVDSTHRCVKYGPILQYAIKKAASLP